MHKINLSNGKGVLDKSPSNLDTQNPHIQSLTLNVENVIDTNTHMKLRHPIKVTQGNLHIITPHSREDTDQG